MPIVSEVCGYLDELAPVELGEEWDNVGLLVGRAASDVQKIMTCLTLTPDVAQEAVEQQAQLVVAHHPVLFRGAKAICDHTSEGRMLLDLIENGVAVYSAHTRFDSAQQGVNQRLAESFGLADIGPIRASEVVPGLGSGRVGRLKEPVAMADFLVTVRQETRAVYVEYCGKDDSSVATVGVACGAAAEFLDDAVAAGCDTFVTGEARFHGALDARTRGINLILLGHYSSERPAMEWLAEELHRRFPDTEVWASRCERDPLRLSH